MPPSDSPGMTRTDQSDPPLMKKNPWELERKICGILGQIETEIPFESGIKIHCWDFPGGPVAKIQCCQYRGSRLDPWSGNWIPHATAKSSQAATKDPVCHN